MKYGCNGFGWSVIRLSSETVGEFTAQYVLMRWIVDRPENYSAAANSYHRCMCSHKQVPVQVSGNMGSCRMVQSSLQSGSKNHSPIQRGFSAAQGMKSPPRFNALATAFSAAETISSFRSGPKHRPTSSSHLLCRASYMVSRQSSWLSRARDTPLLRGGVPKRIPNTPVPFWSGLDRASL